MVVKCMGCGEEKDGMLIGQIETTKGESIKLCIKCIKFYINHFKKKKPV